MGASFDRWTLLKLFELALAVTCLIYKRLTDDEASRLFLYLQKLSREWSLLNNVTWDRVGEAVANATYGGYVIITAALFIGRIMGELPTHRRIIEYIFLGIGAILYIILGSLEFAALDSVPHDLVDNAAVIGTLSLVEGALFLLDMGGPRAKKPSHNSHRSKHSDPRNISHQTYDVEKQIKSERKHTEEQKPKNGEAKNGHLKNGGDTTNGHRSSQKGKDDMPKRFGIYGKDVADYGHGSETDEAEEFPPKMEHSPVWSKIRKGQYGKYDIVSPAYLYPKHSKPEEIERPPSGPGDPGYVQYTAQHWGETGQKTPRHSPTQV